MSGVLCAPSVIHFSCELSGYCARRYSRADIVDQYINGKSLLLSKIENSQSCVFDRKIDRTDEDPDVILVFQPVLEIIQLILPAGSQYKVVMFPGKNLREFQAKPSGCPGNQCSSVFLYLCYYLSIKA